MINKLSIVGCLPEPVGGVSVFCERLLNLLASDDTNNILFYDLYNGNKSQTNSKYNNVIIKSFSSRRVLKFYSYIKLAFSISKDSSEIVFFNFSTTKSIYIIAFLLLFIRNKSVYICLHHGNLKTQGVLFDYFARLVFKHVDKVFSLNPSQQLFYEKYLSGSNVVQCSSYIKPYQSKKFVSESGIGSSRFKILIAGNSSSHYNVESTLISLVSYLSEISDKLFSVTVSIYGEERSYINYLQNIVSNSTNVSIDYTYNLNSYEFINVITKQNLYIRNTSIDSFGIIVADAINMGVDVIASNVCPRYQGCYTYDYVLDSDYLLILKQYFSSERDHLIKANTKTTDFPTFMLKK